MIEEARFLPYETSLPPSGRVLVIAPHPDDEVIGCGGAVCHHIRAGNPVHIVIVTDESGNAGAVRRREARAAASVSGADGPTFLAFPDRGVRQHRAALARRLATEMHRHRPDVVYAPGAQEAHPDHFEVALATVGAVHSLDCALDLMFYEVGVPLAPNLLIDITEDLSDKLAALRCYASQLAQRPYDRHVAAMATFRSYTLPQAVLAAEAFLRVRSTDLGDRSKLFGVGRQTEMAGWP